MYCYRHQKLVAVGICKTCFKALCPDCAIDVGNGLACIGECESTVRELNEMWDRSAKIYGVGAHKSKVPSTSVLLWGLMSLTTWAVSAIVYFGKGEVDIASIFLATFFTVALGLAIYSARRTGIKC